MSTKIDLASVRERLLERREQVLRDQASALRECHSNHDNFSSDEMDQAANATDFAMAAHAASMDGEEIELIDEALIRIKEGNYGVCDDCSDMIPSPRLEALPFARFCVSCQRRFELEGDPHGDD
ncbi:MAG: TraR/DksA family transcriptional regulator [Planctomycetes bacterium]|nr:TraR/DksA family transcriptional regulator [Planctomycetota bacterium]